MKWRKQTAINNKHNNIGDLQNNKGEHRTEGELQVRGAIASTSIATTNC